MDQSQVYHLSRQLLPHSRIRGYITAPTDGNYNFWISSDNNSGLWLSTDTDPDDKQQNASVRSSFVTTWTASREWNKFPSQKSGVIALTAANKYYVEVLHKEGTGDDHVTVGPSKKGDGTAEPSEVIPGAHLSLYFEGGNVPEGLPPNTNPVGDWTIQLDPVIYNRWTIQGDGSVNLNPSVDALNILKPIIDRISDFVMILTVEGKIMW